MQITITRENLIKILQKAERFTGRNTTLPILSSVLLKTEDGKLKVSATDLEIGAVFESPAKVEEEGSIAVPGKVLIQFLQNINNQNISFQVKKDKLFIKGDNYKININCFSSEDFPIIPSGVKEEILEIKPEDFIEGLNNSVPVVSFNSNRPEISGILLSVQKDSVKFVGTDSFRLSEVVIRSKNKNTKEVSLIIPLRLGQEMIKLIQEEDEVVKIFSNNHQIMLKGKSFTIVSRLIDGSYPPYEQIIPQDSKTKITINKNNLKKGIEMASVFSSKLNDMKISLDFDKKTLKISSQNSEVGDYNFDTGFDGEGENQEIVLNWRFFMDGLDRILEENVVLEINNAFNPLIIKGFKNQQNLYLLMPIRPV